MQLRIDLCVDSPKEWVNTVINDFNNFLMDHADCERKASAMALSFVAKYPNRIEIIQELIDTSIEELEHFKDVYTLMEKRGISLNHEIKQDIYVKSLLNYCRSGREERFLDRLLVASVVETRGAERFKLIYEKLQEEELKSFYQRLWASEAKHGEVFIKMALNYFPREEISERLEFLRQEEGKIIQSLPITSNLH